MRGDLINAAVAVGVFGVLSAMNPSLAADFTVDSTIGHVTVYASGAIVTRTGTVNVAAGTHRLLIRGLPKSIDSAGLRVELQGNAIRLGGVELAQINENQLVSTSERELKRKLEDKTDARAALEDEISGAKTQLQLLDSVASNPTGSAVRPAIDATNLGSVLTTMSSGAAAAHKRIRAAKVELRALDRDIEKLKADLAKVATQSQQSTEVRAMFEADVAGAAVINVSYSVEDAGWHWIYEARLDTQKKRISIERQGQVHQGSGEDWKNVELMLTTAEPEDDIATPVVNSQFLSLREIERPMSGLRASAPQLRSGLEEVVVVTAQKRTAESIGTDFITEYRIPARVSVLADREPRLYPVGRDEFAVDLVARVVPSAGKAAHLEATFVYDRETPLNHGELQLYRDGAFIGQAETPTFLPGAQVRMPFGADERIRVAIRDEPAQSTERGLLSKQVITETRKRYEVTNFHPAAIPVEVVDRIPVSKHADVHIESLKGTTAPTTQDLDGKAGVLQWKFDAQPQKLVAIRHYYSVRYPKDRQLEFADQADD